MSKAKLFQKINKVMASVGSVSKENEVVDKKGKKMYNYTSEEAITKKVHDACVEHGLVMFPVKTESEIVVLEGIAYGNAYKTPITKVTVTYEIGCSETGESVNAQTVGYGADNQDKGSNKAMTGAYKYMQRQTFAISTGDDPDHTPNHELKRIQEEEAKRQNEFAKRKQEQEQKRQEHALASPKQTQNIKAYLQEIAKFREVKSTDVLAKLQEHEQIGDIQWDQLRETTANTALSILHEWYTNAKKEKRA